jgi:hypothetical protein
VYGVYQGRTGLVFLLKAGKVITADLKRRNPPGSVLQPDASQGSTLTQEKSPNINIRGLVCGDRSSPPLFADMDFAGEI